MSDIKKSIDDDAIPYSLFEGFQFDERAMNKALRTTIRISSDIWHRRCGQKLLLPSSALRIADHHLHASAMLAFENDSDWFCVSQAVKCFPVDMLHKKSVDEAHSSLFVTKVGTSSIHLGNSVMLQDETLATTQRVFCRVSTSASASAAFTAQERNKFLEFHHTADMLPQLERFEAKLPDSKNSILSVKVGPQHINFANHVDHAFLAETAHHALHLMNKGSENLVINYFGQPFLGDNLQCFAQDDKVYITRTDDDTGESTLIVVAK